MYYGIQIANSVLSMDLYLAIYNPFKSQNARLKQEVVLMVVIMIVFGYFYNPQSVYFIFALNITFASLTTTFVFKSIKRLRQTGTS